MWTYLSQSVIIFTITIIIIIMIMLIWCIVLLLILFRFCEKHKNGLCICGKMIKDGEDTLDCRLKGHHHQYVNDDNHY